MCSINEEELDDIAQCMEQRSIKTSVGSLCKKCNEIKAAVVLRSKDAYCRNCFLASATHKFRATLGKSKLVRPQDHVLLAFSGSQSSTALLHLINSGLNEANHKRLLFSCTALYIDEGTILDMRTAERNDLCNLIVQEVEKTDIPIYVTSLEKSLDNSAKISYFKYDAQERYVDEQREEQLRKLFASVQSQTAKEDLLQKLRNRQLLTIAKQMNCTKIFTADTATHLAINLLCNVSLGRGAQLPLDIGFCDTRDPGIMLLRPMRDFMMKEVTFYNVFNGLGTINIPSLGTKAEPHSSIQKLTEKFVTDLQEEFPSTVSTIFRTGEKLSTGGNATLENESCELCQAPLDTATTESSALQATEFSRMVSALGPSGFDKSEGNLNSTQSSALLGSSENCNLTIDKKSGGSCIDKSCEMPPTTLSEDRKTCHCKGGSISVTSSEAESSLCYSCRLIVREMDTLENLPSEVLTRIKERARFKEMRKEIENFLL